MEVVQETKSGIMICISFETSVYPLYGCIFNYKAKLLFKLSWLIIDSSKASYGDFPGGPTVKTHGPNAGGPGSIPGQGTRSRMMQLKIPYTATKIPHAASKTQRR